MAIVLEEKTISRRWLRGANPTLEYLYFATGSADDVAVRDFVEANVPSSVAGLPRLTVELEAEWVDTDADDGRWDIIVSFGLLAPTGVGVTIFSFDTTGGTQHVTQSISTLSRSAPSNETAPDHEGAIGVSEDGVDGVDIQVPVYKFSETHYKLDSVVTAGYKSDIFSLTGKVNNAIFKGFAAGECLFIGCQGAKRGDDEWELNFRFAASPNRTDITIGKITVAAKWGWEYLWVQYKEKSQGTGNARVNARVPRAAYVEKVYETGDMSLLLIGV